MHAMMRFSKILLATTALVAVGGLALRAEAQTLPTGGSVAAGQVAIGAPNAGRMAITQGSQNAIVNWQGFSIGQGGRVDITQPNSSAAMLNRVTGQAPSTIAGQLNANGRVFLVNPNGIAITQSGVVNTGSFVASTLGISDSDFLAGRLRFQGNGASAAVSNAGRIQAGPGGYAALLGGAVDNSGTISVPMGRIGLGSGERVTLDLSGDGFLQVALPSAAGGDQALVSNSGRLSAPGGRVEIAAATAQAAARHAINMSGVVEAQSVSGTAGSITFSGGPGGTVNVSGRVDASSTTGRGGNVTMTGAKIALRGAEVNASGATGGGRVRIGGDRLGQGDLPRAQRVTVDNTSVIRADATTRGNGGDIVLWSEGRTDFAGSISARGGAEGGRGGEAEVSSRGVLNYTGFADLRAPLGGWGTLLLDPYNITISNGTQTTGAGFTATTDDSVINAGTLVTALGAANVVVSTGTGGTQAGDITLAVPLAWSSAGNLTLQAAGAIALNGAVTATAGGLTLQAGGSSTISATGAISVGRFELASGNWVQNTAPLPGFAATDFRITGGSFLRAAGGAGTGADPYRLTDIYGVQGMGSSAALLGASYRLANDIAAAGTSGWNGGAGFVPVGTLAARFTGSLDGAGYVINGLTIDRPGQNQVGLFGVTGSASTISKIGLQGGSVRGSISVGGLVGFNFGTIEQAYATGGVTGTEQVGGLVGFNRGAITQAYASGNVTGTVDVGGLVGMHFGGTITQVYATGAVTGNFNLGGLAGNNLATITQAYATGDVTGSFNRGALVGANSGTITASRWDSDIAGSVPGIGLTGGTVSDTIGLTTADARSQGGYGIWDFKTVWYQAGDMRPILRSEAATAVGGVISIRNLNQLQLMNINIAGNYRLTGNIDASATNGTHAAGIWGSGGFVPVGTFAARFTGSLDGAGYVINGLTINRPNTDVVGLIGVAGSGSSISNLGLVGGSVTGSDFVGGLVGFSAAGSSITQSYATGEVTGRNSVGGLVGENGGGSITQAYATGRVEGTGSFVGGLMGYNGGVVRQAYATGTVMGEISVGGLVGMNDGGSITQAYATGRVEGTGSFVGGLMGYNVGVVRQAYATGAVTGGGNVGGLVGFNFGTIEQSYWDTQTTGRLTSAGGTGLDTAQARSAASYVGWDFGTVWYQAGDMRPILRSEAATADVNGVITIRNLNQLQLMGANLAGNYRLAGDIDASASSGSNAAGIWGSGGFVPVGTSTARFTGRLDGAGNVINGLTINRLTMDVVGLIGFAGNGSSISNLGLVGGSVTGSDFVGGLVGFSAAGSSITQSYATGEVTGRNSVGGLVGENGGSITQAYAIGAVVGSGLYVGGLVGFNAGGITEAYATGAVAGSSDHVGGLVGYNAGGTITQAYATGAVTGDFNVGGLVGYSFGGTISQSYATGAVTGQDNVGGLVGVNDGTLGGASITQAYATGAVTGTGDNVGGLVGANGGSIEQAYATGEVRGNTEVGGLVGYNDGGSITQAYASGAVSGSTNVGGLVGWQASGSITQAYWDTETTRQTAGVGLGDSTGATGLDPAQARSATSYTGWDFGTVWYQAGDMRPILRSEAATPVGGVITIRNLNQLQLMGANLSGSYRLTGDIDASASSGSNASGIWGSGGFVPVGTNAARFMGSLDGAGYVINNLIINRPTTDFVGLIGYAGSGSSISNLGLVGGSVTGSARVGGLAGANAGTIRQAYVTGAVTGISFSVGGLVGRTDSGSLITQSYATGQVEGEYNVGGLVGYNPVNSLITRSYATGAVTGQDDLGGLVGFNPGGNITQSYATGAVSAVSGTGFNVGGLVGYKDGGNITQAYATGAVTGTTSVGGLVGQNRAGNITQAYASGAVSGSTNVGGLVGWQAGGSVTQAYWDTETTGRTNGVGLGDSTGATGLDTAQARSATSYTGWDFGTVWYQAADMRPILRSEAATPVGGVITIRNLNQLQLMGANLAGSYRLAGNIDASATNTIDRSPGDRIPGIWGSGGFVPVGTLSARFTGSLDGAGYRITGLTINRPNADYVGLIGVAGSGSSISNLGLVGGSVTGNAFVGGLVGENVGTITQAYATGPVTGDFNVGGLVGRNSGSITQAYATGDVEGSGNNVGGLVGWNDNGGTITQAYATGPVTGDFNVGGLVGRNSGSITQAYATGDVEGSGNNVGGLVGWNDNGGTITQAYATGAVTGSNRDVGGLVGLFTNGAITQAYATGAVMGDFNVGGLVGSNDGGSITQTYATGSVTGGGINVGGLVGFNSGSITQSYWNTDSRGAPGVGDGSADGVTGLTTLQMQDFTSFATTYAGWDFAKIWSPPNQVGQNNNSDTAHYPQLYGVGPVVPVAFTTSLSFSSRVYGASNPTASFTTTGLRAGDTVATQPLVVGMPGIMANVGIYQVSGSGAVLKTPSGSVYRVIYVPAPLEVTRASLTITGGTTTSTYTGVAQTNTSALTTVGLLGSDSVTGVSGRASGTNAGTYNDVLFGATGTGLGNYTISYVNGRLIINPRQITVRADDLARDYNSANPALTYRITSGSLVNGDGFTGGLVTTAERLSSPGSYPITQGSLSLSANYTISFVPGTLTVRPTALITSGVFGSTLASWMDQNGQLFWMRLGSTQRPFSGTDMSFGTAFFTELLSSGGLNAP